MESESKQCDRCNVEKVQLLLCDERWTDSIIQIEHAKHMHTSLIGNLNYWHPVTIDTVSTKPWLNCNWLSQSEKILKVISLSVVGIGGNGKRMVLTVWRNKYRFHTLTTWTLCYPWPVLNLIMLHNSSWTFRSPLFAALIDSDFNRSLKSERWLPSENKAIFFRVR